ncbi:hypothetical protein [Amycolatopsis sp. NPDC098790]|uniref:hypothetical protein n=1 Tax=Amycolatopsis sp. NPDC098790 TaxID=3363939 RepID=UPI0037FB335D
MTDENPATGLHEGACREGPIQQLGKDAGPHPEPLLDQHRDTGPVEWTVLPSKQIDEPADIRRECGAGCAKRVPIGPRCHPFLL